VNVERVAIRPWHAALAQPLETARGPLRWRDGFLLEIASDGVVGTGEASPAYWIGDEPLATTRAVLDEAAALVGAETDELPAVVARWRLRSPAAACALDTARLDLETRSRGLPLAAPLGGRVGDVPVAALIAPSDVATMAERAAGLAGLGYGTLKLKVGSRPVADDVARVSAIREQCPTVRLRLDANRAWSLAEAERALARLAHLRLDYVEEPLHADDPHAWARLRQIGVPLALDESVASLDDLERRGGAADVVVVKAARLGGPAATVRVGGAARERGLRVVVTDSIESTVGQALAVHLAAALHAPGDAVGLGGAFLFAPGSGGIAASIGGHARPAGPGLGV
jgi:o-succinylbenzoate synthase